jgi:hypothetical protein
MCRMFCINTLARAPRCARLLRFIPLHRRGECRVAVRTSSDVSTPSHGPLLYLEQPESAEGLEIVQVLVLRI